MAAPNQFSLTYYVGALLAHGGILSVESDKVVFSPGTVERALGASSTEIPFDKIKMVEVVGTITESLMIRTAEKAHRFVGGDPHKIREIVDQAVQAYAATAPAPVSIPVKATASPAASSGSASSPAANATQSQKAVTPIPVHVCQGCKQTIRSEFHYCPFCRAVLKLSCPQCYRTIDTGWKFCAFCGVQYQYQ